MSEGRPNLSETMSRLVVEHSDDIMPICASCKKIQNEGGDWQQIELYLREHAPVEFSHGMCPECTHLWFPEQGEQ